VAENVRVLRRQEGLELAALSARLEGLGQPISVSGLSKLELGTRGVDVDDLVALAVALDVSPSRLLMSPTASRDKPVKLTPNTEASEEAAWNWMAGDRSLRWPEVVATGEWDLKPLIRWIDENRPHAPASGQLTVDEVSGQETHLLPVAAAAIKASEQTGWPHTKTLRATGWILRMAEVNKQLARLARRDDEAGS